MYLKSIRAFGFKSFADKTDIEIKDGITGIVGPNGSGKSNVVDAIKWVLGEQSVKALRGSDKMTDVIFSGSSSRDAQTRAMVALTFDNSDHYLNSEFNELEIKRVVYKTGENEYYINNTKTRLKDITDLFIDSGAGRESFNIIGQGAVMDIVNSKPEDRRQIFESAACVLKYKKRKEESLRKLDKTHENLERISLLIDELKITVDPLKEQAEVAKKYLDYKNQLSDIEIALIASDIYNINEEYSNIKNDIDKLNEELLNIDVTNNEETSKIEKLKLKNIKLDEQISKNNDELIKISKEIADLQSLKQVTLERKKYEVEDIKLQNNIVSLKENELTIKKNITSHEKDIEDLKIEINKIDKTKLDIETDSNKINKNKVSLINDLNIKTKELYSIKSQIEILESNIENDSKLPYSVKSILNNPRLSGIHGVIGKVIETNNDYTKAIETALGFNINVVIVENEYYAKEAINYLKENKLGRATFFPMNIIKPKYVDDNTLAKIDKVSGYLGLASNLVTYNKEYDNIIKNQLGNVIVVDDIDSLNKIGKLIDYKYRIVSLDGEIQYSGGSITGGTTKTTSGIINQKYELEQLNKKQVNITKEINNINDNLKDINISIEDNEEKRNNIQKNLIDLNEQLNRKNITLKDLNDNLDTISNEIKGTEDVKENKLDNELDEILTNFYAKTSSKEILEKELTQLKNQKMDLTTEISELDLKYRNINSEYNKKQNNLKQAEIKLGKMDVKLDNLLLNLNENYSLTYEAAKEKYTLDIEEESARLTVNKLKSSIKDLGDVNTGSISEYERVSTRYNFLNEQKTDLEAAIDSLLDIINEMDEIMKEKFMNSFEEIKVEFAIVFKKLFKGGEGKLVLTDPDNILETGIDIIAEPPGKKLNNTIALSGGEKTLTAIALLFAILNVKPVPFVILDEVEAALDEANVEAFGKYLQSKKDKSQFIVITHKKRTMEYADVLYGITMQESGVSKIVSVALED